MDIKAYRTLLKDAIIEKDIGKVMQELNNNINSQVPVYNDLINLRTRLQAHHTLSTGGTESKESLRLVANKIRVDFLSLIDALQPADLLSFEVEFNPEGFVQFRKIEPVKNSAFLSTPIASLKSEEEYGALKAVANDILDTLLYKCNLPIYYYAGSTISSFQDFHTPEASIKQDFQAIHLYEYFIMVYPYKVPTSALVEAGYAMALNKKCIFFVKDRTDLPFLLKEADKVFKNVKTKVYKVPTDIPDLLQEPGLFDF